MIRWIQGLFLKITKKKNAREGTFARFLH